MVLCGNSLIMAAITCSSRLRTPTYFFLVSLSVLDAVCSCTVVPKLLEILAAGKKSISCGGCMAQMYFLLSSVTGEVLFFTAMAYDHYMSVCWAQGVCCTGGACVGHRSWSQHLPDATLTFCGPNVVNHFCEMPPLLPLFSSSTYVNDLMAVVTSSLLCLISCSPWCPMASPSPPS